MSWLLVFVKDRGLSSPAASGPAEAGAFRAAVTFVNASLPLPLPADDFGWPDPIRPVA